MPAPYAVTFVGTLDDTLLTWSGTVTGYAGCPCGFTATRPSVGAFGVASAPASAKRDLPSTRTYGLSAAASGLSKSNPNSLGFSPMTAAETIDST